MKVTVEAGPNISASFTVKNSVAIKWLNWIFIALGYGQVEIDSWSNQEKAERYLAFLKQASRDYKRNGVRAAALRAAEADVPDGDDDFEEDE